MFIVIDGPGCGPRGQLSRSNISMGPQQPVAQQRGVKEESRRERTHTHKKKSQVGVNKERSWGSSRSKLCTVLQYVMLDLAAHSNDKKPGKKSWWKVGLAEKYHNDGWPLEHCYFTTCIRLFPEKWHGFTTTMMSVSDIGVKADTISSFLWNLKL